MDGGDCQPFRLERVQGRLDGHRPQLSAGYAEPLGELVQRQRSVGSKSSVTRPLEVTDPCRRSAAYTESAIRAAFLSRQRPPLVRQPSPNFQRQRSGLLSQYCDLDTRLSDGYTLSPLASRL